VRQLVDEGFEIERVVVDVHAAPIARRHRRIAHGVLDQQIRKIIAELGVARRDEALQCGGIEAVLDRLWPDARGDRLSG